MPELLKTNVDQSGLTALIQRLGRDCTPTQFMREFAKNGIEAIQRTGTNGKLIIDFNKSIYKKYNQYKICFTDTGDGMTGEEMLKHLNNLSSSGAVSNEHENYGMGAKIASLTRNPAGIIYESWKEGKGTRVVIGYDRLERAYGIQPDESTDGSTTWYSPISEESKPAEIGRHGTRVTLLGSDFEKDDTMLPPKGTQGGKGAWIFRSLNTRFFRIPESVEVLTRVGYHVPTTDTKHNHMRKVIGQQSTLDKNAESSGKVRLTDAIAWWWIIKEGTDGHGRELVKGHTACLNQDEVFDIGEGRQHRGPGFGIVFGKEQVVIYIQPLRGYVQNTARTGLVQQDGSPLPWTRWEDEFRANKPKEIEDFIAKRMAAVTNDSNSDSIKQRLKSIASFFKMTHYKKSKSGVSTADPASETQTNTGPARTGERKGNTTESAAKGFGSGALTDFLMSQTADIGETAETVNLESFPSCRWVSIKNKTREFNDDLEDRAATYHHRDNMIVANWDFQGFQDVMTHFAKKYGSFDGAEELIKKEVREAFEQQLIETVTGATGLRSRPKWNPTQCEEAVSQESLTAAVMPRYHLLKYIEQQLAKALGKVRTSRHCLISA